MQLVIDVDENLYTRLFGNGEITFSDAVKACTTILKGKEYNTFNKEKWTSVKDGLPEKDGKYLCTTHGIGFDFVEVLCFANNLSKVDDFDFFGYNRAGWYDYDSETWYYEVKGVVAWMERTTRCSGKNQRERSKR